MVTRTEPASTGQRLLWMLAHHGGAAGALNCPLLCRLHGPLDDAALDRAVARLTARHESLRTTFSGRGRHLTQVINPPRPVPVARIDLSRSDDPQALLRAAIADELGTPIDVEAWPSRVTCWRLGADEHALCVNVHHMVTDAWSCGVIFRELTELYAHAAGAPRDPGPPGWQYRRWVSWQKANERETWPRHRAYWQRQLNGMELPALALSEAANGGTAGTTARAVAEIDRSTADALGRLARSRKVTLFAVMLTVYYALLHGETGQEDLAVASLFANRTRSEVERTIGFLANLVVLRTALPASERFEALLERVQRTVVEAMVHQELPYHLLPANILPPGHRRVDDVVFQMLPGLGERARAGAVEAEVLVPDAVVSRFALELTVIPHPAGLTALLQYGEQRIGARPAERLVARYREIAGAAARAPHRTVQELTNSRLHAHNHQI